MSYSIQAWLIPDVVNHYVEMSIYVTPGWLTVSSTYKSYLWFQLIKYHSNYGTAKPLQMQQYWVTAVIMYFFMCTSILKLARVFPGLKLVRNLARWHKISMQQLVYKFWKLISRIFPEILTGSIEVSWIFSGFEASRCACRNQQTKTARLLIIKFWKIGPWTLLASINS